MTGILGCSNAEGKLCKHSVIPVEVHSTWCTKNDARVLFPVGARSVKMAVRKTSIFREVYLFQTLLFVPSLKLLLEKLTA